MQTPVLFLGALLSAATLVAANKDNIDQDYTQLCSGMYSKDSWGGRINPFISTNLLSYHGEGSHSSESHSEDDIDISVVVFEYKDIDILGKPMSDGNKKYICDTNAIELKFCEESQKGTFIVNEDKKGLNTSQILTYSIKSKGLNKDDKYPIKSTGYYCVATFSKKRAANFKIQVNFQNSFGNIAAAEYPKLSLYAALAIAYAISFAYYAFNFYKHRHEVLPLQKYFLFFFVFLTLETVLIWSYYDLENAKGAQNAGVKVYMVFISILNGFKFSFSFFLLLVICLGYGIVVPKLEKKLMRRAQALAAVHFIFATVYIIINYLSTPEDEVNLAGLVVIPVMLLTVAFYVITLKSLSATTLLLQQQKQMIKLGMYRKLFRIIFFSLLALIFGVFISSFVFIGMSTTDLIEQHWKTRFFYLEFWPSLVYFFIFNSIAFIWRPTDTSYMLAASQQVASDPSNAADFELDDLQSLQESGPGQYQNLDDNDSLNLQSDDDEESRIGEGNSTEQQNSDDRIENDKKRKD